MDVSPSSSSFLTAILRRMRLMILPDLVFGSPEHSTSRCEVPACHIGITHMTARMLLGQTLHELQQVHTRME